MKSEASARYLRRLKGALVCRRTQREALLAQGERMLAGFREENPEGGYQALVTAFGPPEALAEEMLSTLEPGEVTAARTRRAWFRRGLAALTAAALVFCAAFWYSRWRKAQEIVDNTFYSVPGEAVTVTPEEFKNIFGVYPDEIN